MSERSIGKAISAFLIAVAAWTIFSGVHCDVIDVDAAHYATISMEMLQNRTFLTVTERGNDYLDKPPFLFWINSLSFAVFGFTNFGYKLPSLIISILGLFFTYKLGSYLSDKNTGRIAAVIFGTSIGYFWITNDVKTDAIVTASIVYSLYYLIRYLDSSKMKYLVLGSIGIGIGMLTKGPMGLVFPFAAVFIHLAIKREIRKIFRLQWILLIAIVAIMLLPMCMGLYQQFDMHPEKVVHGKSGVSGLRFYFWEQSFGRITGENKWNNNTSFFYLFGAFILLVFPYSALTAAAYYQSIKRTLKDRGRSEYYVFGGSLLILVLLSLSYYKIPQYAAVVIPLAGIIVAQELTKWASAGPPRWIHIHNIVVACIVFILSGLSFLIFKFHWIHIPVTFLLLISYIYFQSKRKIINSLFVIGLTVGFVFNSHLIPGFQEYSEGRRFADLIRENNLQNERLYFFNRNSRALEFYLQRYMEVVSWEDIIDGWKRGEDAWYYMSLDGKEALLDSGLEIDKEISLLINQMTRIEPAFLNPKTRDESLEYRFLIKFKPG